MADNPTTKSDKSLFVPNPNAITEASWKAITTEREELQKKRDGADCELMYQYYNTQLRTSRKFYLRAQKAQAVLETKTDSKASKTRHEQRRKEAKAAQDKAG
jgi:hypothetical protein